MKLTPEHVESLFRHHEANNSFETLIEQCYSHILNPGDAAVDGGAHVGMHTLPMARLVGDRGSVFAYEPIRSLADTVVYNCRDLPQVRVFNAALAAANGRTKFHLMSDEPWLSGIARRFENTDKPVTVIEVATLALDELAAQPIRFIKLDLEGGEYHALRGACGLLAAQQPIVALECGRVDAATIGGYSSTEYFGMFNEVGYQLCDLFGQPFLPHHFQRPWNDRTVPHYIVAMPAKNQVIATMLQRNALALIA